MYASIYGSFLHGKCAYCVVNKLIICFLPLDVAWRVLDVVKEQSEGQRHRQFIVNVSVLTALHLTADGLGLSINRFLFDALPSIVITMWDYRSCLMAALE